MTNLDLGALLDDRSTGVIVCTGAGGVGKTTTAAALALHAAERGRRVVVLTIDPARRLAQALGLTELDNTPRPVVGVDPSAGGSLDAMMLDMKRTFDEVVLTHADPETAQQILDNSIYQAVSSSFAGTQEYMAMERLGQLRSEADADGSWDLIVVDTPPSRSALDFLDAPQRLGSFLDGPPGTPTQTTELFSIRFGWGVAAFLFLSAIAHFLIAGPLFGTYANQLRRGRNDFRWIEYALSASWMIVLIAMLTGASDFAALIGLFGVNAAMILFGLIAERSGQPGGSGWQLPYWLGTLFGAVPWIVIAINLWAPGQDSSAPTFVYFIFVTIFVFFDSFALNFWLQYRKVGRWHSYLFGETAYVVLSLVAKSLLAWQVFAGALAS